MEKFDVSKFRNVSVAFTTPFSADGSLDRKGVKALARYYLNKGVKSLYLCGSTGEAFLLDNKERMEVVDAVMEEVGGEMIIIVHVGSVSTIHSAELARHAELSGADATSAVPCVYYRPGEEGIYRHWTEITEAADLPFFIYNIPQLTGYALSMDLFNRMLKNERVAGMKNSSEPVHDILRFKEAGGKDFIVFNGPDEQYLAGRMMGADAGIGGTYGAMPELFIILEEHIRQGRIEKAQELQRVINDFIYRILALPSLFGAVKAILRLDGCDVGLPRLPLLPADENDPIVIQLYKDIRQAVERAGGK